MMGKYLRKRNLYDLAVKNLKNLVVKGDLVDCEPPSCKYCDYKSYHGYEWLTFFTELGYVKVTSSYLGRVLRICIKEDDGGKGIIVFDSFIYPVEDLQALQTSQNGGSYG